MTYQSKKHKEVFGKGGSEKECGRLFGKIHRTTDKKVVEKI